MKITKQRANMMLLLISALWGSGFVVTKIAVDVHVSAGFINFARGFIFTILTLLIFHNKISKITLNDLKTGLLVGLLNFGGCITQTVGVEYTTPSNNAFISSTYVVIVPFIAWVVYKKPLRMNSFLAIVFCLLGMAILTGVPKEGFVLNLGDVYSFFAAFLYAASIAYISYGTQKTDAAMVALMLALVQAIGGLGFFFFADSGKLKDINWQAALWPLLYLGIICSFVSQTIQVTAQRYTSATTAGLIMMLEGLFGSLFSVAFGFEPFTFSLAVGGSIIMLALVFMEFKFEVKSSNQNF